MTDYLLIKIVYFEYISLAVMLVLCISLLFTLELLKRKKEWKGQFLSQMILQMITKKIDVFYHFVPKPFVKAKLLIPEIIKIDNILSDSYWDYLKQEIVTIHLREEMLKLLHSTFWINKYTALLGISVCPTEEYLPLTIKILSKKHGLLNLAATKCALLYGISLTTKETINKIAKEPLRSQFLYRDLIINATFEIYEQTYAYFQETKDFENKLACLKILSLRTGFLSYDELTPFIHHESFEVRWWGLRALENTPCKEGVETLINALKDSEWIIRALAAHILGMLRAKQSIENLQESLGDEHYFVKLMSAHSLSGLGKDGEKILELEMKNPNPNIRGTCQLVQTFSYESLQHSLQKIFPINQDPLIILGAFL